MNLKTSYRIIVAEDEPLILENIVQKIEGLDFPFQIVGTALNGEDALELIRRHHPHILFTDIRMPLMDGLELIERAVSVAPDMQIVIISGYDEFDYARKALRFGVMDYLLKPVKVTALTETAKKLYRNLSNASSVHEREIITGSLHGQPCSSALPFAFSERRFYLHLICIGNLYDNCLSGLNTDAIHSQWTSLDVSKLVGSYVENSACSCPAEGAESPSRPDSKGQADAGEQWWLTDEKSPNRKMLVTTCPPRDSVNSLYSRLEQAASPDISVTVCSARNSVAFTDIWKRAQELRVYLKEHLIPCTSSHFYFEGTCPPEQQSTQTEHAVSRSRSSENDSLPEILNMAAFCCKRGQLPAARENLSRFFCACREAKIPQTTLEMYLASITSQLEEGPDHSFTPTAAAAQLKQQLFEQIATAADSDTMYRELEELLTDYVNCQYTPEESSRDLFESIRQYIDDHYLEPITIQTISDVFHFSPSYISRIFKKYNEQPPMRCLTNLRMEEAKRLIAGHDDLSFAAIAEMTGYPDPHYFSRTFKNVTGYSPSEYRETHRERY